MKVLNDSNVQSVGSYTSREQSYILKRFCFNLEDTNTAITRNNAG